MNDHIWNQIKSIRNEIKPSIRIDERGAHGPAGRAHGQQHRPVVHYDAKDLRRGMFVQPRTHATRPSKMDDHSRILRLIALVFVFTMQSIHTA